MSDKVNGTAQKYGIKLSMHGFILAWGGRGIEIS